MRYRPLSSRRPGLRLAGFGQPPAIAQAVMSGANTLRLTFYLPVLTPTDNGFFVTVDGLLRGILVGGQVGTNAYEITFGGAATTHTSAVLLTYNGNEFMLGTNGDVAVPLPGFVGYQIAPVP